MLSDGGVMARRASTTYTRAGWGGWMPFGLVFALALSPAALLAQDSATELAQTAANPIADLISVPFQLNNDFGIGDFDRTRNVLNIQPVIPLAHGKIVTRTILPIVWLPDITAASGRSSSGLGDILFTAFYVPASRSMMWGVGPALEMPSGGEHRGTQKWSLGPSAVVLSQSGPWTLGVLLNNVWSIAGKSQRDDVNKGLLQYFIVRQLGNGWYVNSAPVITVNWKAQSGQRWVVPFGVGGGKLLFLGKLPINIQSQAYYNAAKPDLGPNWQVRVQVQVLLPTP